MRSQISGGDEDTSLLHRSIRSNIRYGRPTASEEDIVRAAKLAHAHDFILDLEDWQGRRGDETPSGMNCGTHSGALSRLKTSSPATLCLA